MCVHISTYIHTLARALTHHTPSSHAHARARACTHTHTHTMRILHAHRDPRTYARTLVHTQSRTLVAHAHARVHASHTFYRESFLYRTHSTKNTYYRDTNPYVSTPFWSCRLVDQRSCQREQSPATFLRLRVFGARCSWSDSTSAPAP
jgi:hypothetical protein